MIGLSLEGGGTKGSYQVGAYKAFLEMGIKFDGITGTSIGSFNGAMFVANKYEELEYFWLNEDFGKLLGYLEDLNVERESILDDIVSFLTPIKTYIGNQGLDVDKLTEKLESLLDEKLIRDSYMDFGLVTYKVKDNKSLYLFKEDIPNGKIIDYIIASCFLPVFKPKKLDDDSHYLDGGFVDVSPSNMLEDKGYKKIYIISLKGLGFEKKKHKKAEIIKISPSRPLGALINVNKKQMANNIEMGYYDTIKVLKNLDGIKFVFEKKSKWLYNLLVRKVSSRTLRRAEVFFFTKNKKILVIKTLEYILEKEKYTYNNIYDPFKLINELKQIDKDSIAYKFIKELKIF